MFYLIKYQFLSPCMEFCLAYKECLKILRIMLIPDDALSRRSKTLLSELFNISTFIRLITIDCKNTNRQTHGRTKSKHNKICMQVNVCSMLYAQWYILFSIISLYALKYCWSKRTFLIAHVHTICHMSSQTTW